MILVGAARRVAGRFFARFSAETAGCAGAGQLARGCRLARRLGRLSRAAARSLGWVWPAGNGTDQAAVKGGMHVMHTTCAGIAPLPEYGKQFVYFISEESLSWRA